MENFFDYFAILGLIFDCVYGNIRVDRKAKVLDENLNKRKYKKLYLSMCFRFSKV